MKVQVMVNDELVKMIDDYANSIGVSRSAVFGILTKIGYDYVTQMTQPVIEYKDVPVDGRAIIL